MICKYDKSAGARYENSEKALIVDDGAEIVSTMDGTFALFSRVGYLLKPS